MLKIGINEDLVLSSMTISEHNGKMAIDFSFGGDAKSDDPFSQQLDADGYVITGNGHSIKVWAPTPANENDFNGNPLTAEERAKKTLNSVSELGNLLRQFALCYKTSDKLQFGDYLRGTGVTKENWITALPNEAVLQAITRNYVADFISSVSDCFGNSDYKLRVICVRQSKDKAYPAFRKTFIKDNPVVEPMLIPLTATKLKFTKREKENGLDSDTPVEMTPDTPADNTTTNGSIFGAAPEQEG